MKYSIYILLLLAFFSCNKKADSVTPAATSVSIIGKWTFKTIKNLEGNNTINAKTGATIDITATSYTASQSVPFTSTIAGETYSFETKGGTAQVTTLKEVKAIINSMAVDAADKKLVEGFLAKYEAEGVKNIAMFTGMSLIVKSKDGSFTIPWQLYSIKELTASKLVLELFYGELLTGESTPIAERLAITLEK
jgi:hypothetical protein